MSRAQRIDDGDNHNAPYQDTSTARFIDPRTLSKAVDAILPKERAVASDSGHFCGWVPRFLRVPNAQGLMPQPFLPVGRSRPRLGHRPGHRQSGALAVLGAGDGGFLMSLADLETAVRLKLRMCILVYNDSSYAAEVHLFRRRGYSDRYRAVSRHRFRSHRAGSWRRAATVGRLTISTVTGLGARGRAGCLRDRCQDQSRPGGRLARRAFSLTVAKCERLRTVNQRTRSEVSYGVKSWPAGRVTGSAEVPPIADGLSCSAASGDLAAKGGL